MSVIDLIFNWKVTNDILTSDHRCISFNLNLKRPPVKPYRNRKLTDWGLFSIELASLLPPLKDIQSAEDIDKEATLLSTAISASFDNSCPLICNQKSRNKPFWNSELKRLRKHTRKLKNKARMSNFSEDWNSFLVAQKVYKKNLRSAHRSSWLEFCDEINSLSAVARLCKTLGKNNNRCLDVLRLPDGRPTSSNREVGELLLAVHFPGCDVISSDSAARPINSFAEPPNWELARNLITHDVLHWSLFSFAPYKAGGPDGIFPAELQHGFPSIHGHLLNLFQACIAFSTVPLSWSRSRVVFIPKVGKSDYTDPKSFRPISLSSIFLKALERIIDRFIRDNALSVSPLSNMQHAYRVGKSCETALHELVTRIERSLNNKEFLVGTFLDIEGAFDCTSFKAISNACLHYGIDPTIVKWIESMLKSRVAETELDGISVSVKVTKGCPQGGVLSPLLWLLVIDELLIRLWQAGFIVQGYADDLVLTVSGKHLSMLSELTQQALSIVESWCTEKNLSVNPSKTNLIIFTRRRCTHDFSVPILFGNAVSRSENVKHLGVFLDSKLTWNYHLEYKLQKATAIFWQCRRAFGKSWGLSPKMLSFMYKSLVLPFLSYASIVWWPVIKTKTSTVKLNCLQNIACRAITGAMASTPLLALESILCLPQLSTFILVSACSAAFRLKCIGAWNTMGAIVGHRQIFKNFTSLPEIDMVNDRLLPEFNFNKLFSVIYPSRDLWASPDFLSGLSQSLVFFSDGSRSEFSAGFGTYCPMYDLRSSGSLGSFCTVFQAELIALTHSVMDALNLAVVNQHIYLCSDSKAVLNSLNNPLIISKLVRECKFFINLLCSNNRVTVMWVPAHYDIEGNEIADSLAKSASRLTLIGPEPAAPLSFDYGKKVIKNFALSDLRWKWFATTTCRKSKLFISEPNLKFSNYALSLKKDQIRVLVSILTGHGRFNDHLHRIGLSQDDICENCLEEVDDSIHFVCSCPAFEGVRSRVFNSRSISVSQLCSLPWSKLVQFSKAAVRISELG